MGTFGRAVVVSAAVGIRMTAIAEAAEQHRAICSFTDVNYVTNGAKTTNSGRFHDTIPNCAIASAR